MEKERYGALDGMRVYSAIGIAAMHVLGAGQYDLPGRMLESLISSFTDLVYLFMAISCFSMCCGSWLEQFPSKRFTAGDMRGCGRFSRR